MLLNESECNPAPIKYFVSRKTKIIFAFGCLIGLLVYFYLIIDRRNSQKNFILENHVAAIRITPATLPDFKIFDVKNNNFVSLKNNNNQWTLLNIWATWCASCQQEMPSLELLHQQLGTKIKIIALSVDDTSDVVAEYIKTHGPSFTIYHDKDQKSASLLGIRKYPETFLINPDGVITTQLSGPRDWAAPSMIKYLMSATNISQR
jgi:thiol-disulfide isomerase/thioredoxin